MKKTLILIGLLLLCRTAQAEDVCAVITGGGSSAAGLTIVAATSDITAATGLTSTHIGSSADIRLIRIQGSGGAADITADPQIADGTDGQVLIIQGDHDTNTVKFEDGTGLALSGGTAFTAGKGDVIAFTHDDGDDIWYELFRSDN